MLGSALPAAMSLHSSDLKAAAGSTGVLFLFPGTVFDNASIYTLLLQVLLVK